MSFGFLKALKELIKNVELFDIALPVITISACIMLYFVFWITDFSWGLIASKYESRGNPDWVTSDKLYSSIGKIGGILLVDTVLISMILFLVVTGFIKSSLLALFISVILNVLAIFYEIHSIGENIKRRTGSKPMMYTLFDRMTTTIEDSFINRIKGAIGGSQQQDFITEDDNENEIPPGHEID